jgi:flagellar protein FliS
LSAARFTQEYQKSAVNTASPLQLIVMLYDGALKFMEAGRHAMANGDLNRQNSSLQQAQRIVLELMACLDTQQGGEIAKNLMGLYTYVLEELVKGNVTDDPECVARSIRVFSELRESWNQVEQAQRNRKDETQAAA